MKKLNVLHVFPTLLPGGAEKLVLYLLANYDRDKLNPAILVIKNKQNSIIEEELERMGVPVFYANKRKGIDLTLAYRINKIIAKFKPQVIHTHLDVLKYVFWPTILQKVPVKVHTIHSLAEKEINATSRKINKIAFKYFNFIPVAISQAVKNSMERVYGVKDYPLIYNGIDISKYKNNVKQERKDFVQLINVARFEESKNHDLLIDAFKIISLQIPDVMLKLVGTGPLKKTIEKKVQSLGLSSRVKCLGVREDVPDLLIKSDIFVFSSKWEGFGLVLVEAMASGLPIVSTNFECVLELVKDNVNGYIVTSSEPREFANALVRLIVDDDLKVKFGIESSQIAKNFDIKRTQENYERLYRQILCRVVKKNEKHKF